MIEKVTGFVLSTVNYGDTSLILNILTKEHGLIGVMGKGVKSIKNPLRSASQKFTYGFFYIYYKKDKLSLLKDIDVIDSFTHLHESIQLISYLNYVTELCAQVYKESESLLLFDLFIAVLKKMDAGFDPLVLTNIFEIKCLPFLGVGILLDECVRCGSKKNIVTVDGDAGGFLCKNCYRNEKIVSLNTVKLLRLYYYIEVDSITKLEIKPIQKEEINSFLNSYYDRYTGLYLKSKDFLKKIKDIL